MDPKFRDEHFSLSLEADLLQCKRVEHPLSLHCIATCRDLIGETRGWLADMLAQEDAVTLQLHSGCDHRWESLHGYLSRRLDYAACLPHTSRA